MFFYIWNGWMWGFHAVRATQLPQLPQFGRKKWCCKPHLDSSRRWFCCWMGFLGSTFMMEMIAMSLPRTSVKNMAWRRVLRISWNLGCNKSILRGNMPITTLAFCIDWYIFIHIYNIWTNLGNQEAIENNIKLQLFWDHFPVGVGSLPQDPKKWYFTHCLWW